VGLALDLAAGLDPVHLARAVGLAPDPWQLAALRSAAPRCLWNCCRQSGKTTIAAVLACHQALYAPGTLTLLVSPSERQSKEAFKKVLAVYGATGRPVPAESETTLWLELANGSRIVGLPGSEKTTRGYSAPTLIVVDEASRVTDELFHSLTPMLATSGGRLLALSTPAGQRGWWHTAWTEGGDAWQRVEVPATACPRISEAFLEAERRGMPDAWWRQEYLCAFAATDDAVFPYEDVQGIVTDDAPLFPDLLSTSLGGAA
jgi:hypothetical protein